MAGRRPAAARAPPAFPTSPPPPRIHTSLDPLLMHRKQREFYAETSLRGDNRCRFARRDRDD